MKRFLITIFMLSLAAYCFASPDDQITGLNSFSPNTTIQSNQVNANNSEIQSSYNVHTHTDVTQTGTITSGTWNGTIITTQYGGTGVNHSSATTGSIIQISGTTTVAIPPPTANGQVLTTNSGTAPQWGTVSAGAKDAITRGFEIVVEQQDALRCVVTAGTLYHNNTEVNTTTGTILTLSTASNWSSGSTVSITNNWNYIGVSSTGQVVYLGILPPNRLDTSGNQATGPVTMVNLYSYDGTTYWRVIGAVREDGSSNIDRYYQRKDVIMWDVPILITTVSSGGAWSSATSCTSAMPNVSKLGIFGMKQAYQNGSDAAVLLRPNGSTWATGAENGIGGNTNSVEENMSSGQRISLTDSNQQIQYYNAGTNLAGFVLDQEGYYLDIR